MDPCDSGLVQVVGFCEHTNELKGSLKLNNFLTSWETISF